MTCEIGMGMKLRFFSTLVLLFALVSCGRTSIPVDKISLSLASFTENYVDVSIRLEGSDSEGYFLSAIFTPPDGYHLYSKDIPLNGVEGLGRPTLLELTEYSQIRALGVLTESVKTMEPNFEPKELLVYPSGTVTLRSPIELPAGNTWLDDTVKVTFMACSESTCKPPVTGKIVNIRVPSVDVYK